LSVFIAYHPCYSHNVPEGHRFPMEKYQLLFQQLSYEGYRQECTVIEPLPIVSELLYTVHTHDYVAKLVDLTCSPREQRVSGFEHNEELIFRELVITEGTRKLTELVAENGGIGINIAGGTHHAYADRGEGFCLLNDFAVSAAWFHKTFPGKNALILDLDVHQGNGTAAIFNVHKAIRTVSFHGKHNYPLHKENSQLDVEFPDGTTDTTYLNQLSVFLDQEAIPDMLFYLCGVDVLATDKLGRLGLTMEGCRKRDELVLSWARKHRIPVVCAMGGGYSPQVSTVVNAHMQTIRLAFQIFS